MGLIMARTRNSFTGSAGDDTLVDKVLGRSYDVVKAVYLKLPKLEELQENPNVNTLVDNFEDVKKVLANTDNISSVSNNLDEILAASDYSVKAKNYSESAQSAAETAATTLEEANTTLQEATEVRNSLQDYQADLEVVADNIQAVKNTSANIQQINYVSGLFQNNLTLQKIEEVLANIDNITSLADNIYEVTQVANKFVGTGELDRIESSAKDIQESLVEYRQVLEDIKQEVIKSQEVIEDVNSAAKQGISDINVEAQLRRMELNSTLEACKELIAQMAEADKVVSANVDTSNEILLKMRDIYHSYEEGINRLNKKIMLMLHHEGDHQVHRSRIEGELQIKRLQDQMTEIIESVLDDFKEAALAIKNQALKELQAKADEIIKCIEKIKCKIYYDLNKFNDRITEIEQKLEELWQTNATQDKGDIRFGYVDYSLPENQGTMVVGTTYLNFYDENHQYIKINQDTNEPERDPFYVRYYIKSASGNVSYIQREAKLDLSAYLKREELKDASTKEKGIVQLATVTEVKEGTNTLKAVTPFALDKALPDILIKKFEQNPNGLTNNIVQQIVKTIADDEHLQEDLAASIADNLEDANIGVKPDEDTTFEQDVTIEGNFTVKGDTVFEGSISVPNQVPADDPAQWPDNTVINKGDVEYLISQAKNTRIEVLPSYPASADTLEEDVLYSCPLKDLGTELLFATLRENEKAETASVEEGEQAFFPAGDLL